MCGLYYYNQRKEKSTGTTDFHVDCPLLEDSNAIPLLSLFFTTNFIDPCIDTLDNNIVWRFLAYQENKRSNEANSCIHKNKTSKFVD